MEDKIEKIITTSIDEINKELNITLKKSDDTEIYGDNSPLDSLGVLTFVMELEKLTFLDKYRNVPIFHFHLNVLILKFLFLLKYIHILMSTLQLN